MSDIEETHFIFDVDGCITPKNKPIDRELYYLIYKLSLNHKVSLVTGSELSSSIEQVGEALVKNLYMSFNCMGNVVYKYGKIIEQNFWFPDESLINFLWDFICASQFPYRTAKHFDLRTGSINVSVIGRNANNFQRQEYSNYDAKTNERVKLANLLANKFDNIEVSIGGNISIDINPKGKNKSQILKYILQDNFVFFGDGHGKWGNDQPLFDAIKSIHNSVGHMVDHWQHTMQIICEQYSKYF